MTNPTYPGILLEARPIALLKMKDTQRADDKILCVAIHDPRYARYKSITDVEEHILKEISHFFQVYKDLEGKKVIIVGGGTGDEAKKIITTAVNSYKKTFGKSLKKSRSGQSEYL